MGTPPGGSYHSPLGSKYNTAESDAIICLKKEALLSLGPSYLFNFTVTDMHVLQFGYIVEFPHLIG